MVSGIIFDMDGVLIDSERQSNEGWLWAAGQLGVDMPMWLIDSFKGAPAELCCKFFDDYYKGVIDYWEAKELRTQHVYKIRETEGIPVKKGVKDIFEYIRNNGLKCAVATSTRRESAEKTLHEIGVWDYLDAVVYGDEVERGKPEPDIFLRAAKAIGVNPSEAVVVEDSINGIKAGYAAGMRVVHIPDTIAIDDDIRKLTYMVCDDLNGLIDVVESINKPVINRKNVINAFAEYVRNYDPSDEMLHDIGRFEQIRRFGTFNDAQSVDHAEFGADLLFKEGLIRKFAEGYYEECELALSDYQSEYCQEERKTKEFLVNNDATAVDDEQIIKNNEHHNKDTGLLEMAIRQHNKYRVKEDLTERQRMFCDILRDADKVDIFKVNADIPMEIIYDVTTDELKSGVISKEVLESFYKRETVLKSVRKSAVDHIVGHISLLFELVYKESYRQAKEQGYVYKLLDFKSDVPEVNAEFDDMRKYVDEFLMEI